MQDELQQRATLQHTTNKSLALIQVNGEALALAHLETTGCYMTSLLLRRVAIKSVFFF
jgi:hypothetical protein